MRLKIVDKSKSIFHIDGNSIGHTGQTTQHLCQLDMIRLPPTDQGYIIVIEGVMPYNTNEGQLVIDMATNQEGMDLVEIQSCEPLEYIDKYVPSKYGIIFKEKIIVQPIDHTAISLNIKLLKGGVDF
jgi:hypothetical protein